ncbi:MAG: hypothetical protein IJT70_03925 [Clostridia bacterium]|nr:hypothetical protein [Clostridia bacterium]
MKKILISALFLLFAAALVSCEGLRDAAGAPQTPTVIVTEPETEPPETEDEGTQPSPTDAETDDTPISDVPRASLYDNTYYEYGVRFDYAKIADYSDDMSGGRDICVLSGFPSEEPLLSGVDLGAVYFSCLREAGLPEDVKMGYLLRFDTPEGKCEKLILRPSDITDDYSDYIEVYIYDDINQEPGAWYSHLLDGEYTEKTIVTSVKLTAGAKIAGVRDLTLTAFCYEPENAENVTVSYAEKYGTATRIVPNPARG